MPLGQKQLITETGNGVFPVAFGWQLSLLARPYSLKIRMLPCDLHGPEPTSIGGGVIPPFFFIVCER